jgi:hypothetical protein
MSQTLRDLLIQRAARLQERSALTAPEWGTLSYAQLRNRVEGIALGLLATPSAPTLYAATGTLWDWAAELAVAASALAWDPSGTQVAREVLGGPRFNHDAGRGPYHALEHSLTEATLFRPGLSHGQWLNQLRRWNERHGWDHDTEITLPLERLCEPALSAALWCSLYAGAHAILASPMPRGHSWNAALFEDLR